MSNLSKRVIAIDDHTLVKVMNEISALFVDQSTTLKFIWMDGLEASASDIEASNNLVGSFAFQEAVLRTQKPAAISVHFRRKIGDQGNAGAIVWKESARFNQFEVTFGNRQELSEEDKKSLKDAIYLISKSCVRSPEENAIEDGNILQQQIVGFGALHSKMLNDLNEAFVQANKRKTELEETFAAQARQRATEHQSLLSKLEAERSKLELQSYKAERRKLLQELVKDAASDRQQANLPKNAIYTRWAVFGASILVALFAGYQAYLSTTELTQSEQQVSQLYVNLKNLLTSSARPSILEGSPDRPLNSEIISAQALLDMVGENFSPTNWFLMAKSFLSSLVALAALTYAATWMKRFYAQDEAMARENSRFHNDLIRANWVIETMLEVQHEHESEVPQDWVSGVTKGLFQEKVSSEAIDDGSQALRALLGVSSSMSIGPDGMTMDVNKKGVKKIAESGNNN